MNNNDKLQLHRPSAVNRYLDIARQTKVPLNIHFNDGEVLKSCVIMEMDSLNLLVKVVDVHEGIAGDEAIITRSSIKKIVTTLQAATKNFDVKAAHQYI